jgi:tetratricopeptide repeat protein
MRNPFEKSIFLSRSGKQQALGIQITAILEKAGYDDHPLVGFALHNLALKYRSTGRLSQAVQLAERATKVVQRSLGDEHPMAQKIGSATESMRRELEESGKKASPKGKR